MTLNKIWDIGWAINEWLVVCVIAFQLHLLLDQPKGAPQNNLDNFAKLGFQIRNTRS